MAYNTTTQLLAGQRLAYTYVRAAFADLTTHLLSAKIDFYHYGDKNVKTFSETEPDISEYVNYQSPKYKEVKFVTTDADAKIFESGFSFPAQQIELQKDAVNNFIPDAFPILHMYMGEYRMKNLLETFGSKLPFGDLLANQTVPWDYAPWKIDGMTPADCRGISFAQVRKAHDVLDASTKHTAWRRAVNPQSPIEKQYELVCALPRALRKYLGNDKAMEYRITGIDKHTMGLMQYTDLVKYPALPDVVFMYVDDSIWLSVDALHTNDIDGAGAGHEGVYALLFYSDACRFALAPASGKIGTNACEKVDNGINGSNDLGLALLDAIGSAVDCPKAFVRIDCNISPIA